MVASFGSLDEDLATRAGLDVVISHPLLEQIIPIIFISTFKPVVSLDVTVRTNAQQTGRTLENGVGRSRAVHLVAIGGRTIMKFIRVGMDVGRKGGFYYGVEGAFTEKLTSHHERNLIATLPSITETGYWERSRVNRRFQVVDKAWPTPSMFAWEYERLRNLIQADRALRHITSLFSTFERSLCAPNSFQRSSEGDIIPPNTKKPIEDIDSDIMVA